MFCVCTFSGVLCEDVNCCLLTGMLRWRCWCCLLCWLCCGCSENLASSQDGPPSFAAKKGKGLLGLFPVYSALKCMTENQRVMWPSWRHHPLTRVAVPQCISGQFPTHNFGFPTPVLHILTVVSIYSLDLVLYILTWPSSWSLTFPFTLQLLQWCQYCHVHCVPDVYPPLSTSLGLRCGRNGSWLSSLHSWWAIMCP